MSWPWGWAASAPRSFPEGSASAGEPFDALAGEEHLVIAGGQGAGREELQLVDALVVQDDSGRIAAPRGQILDRRGEVDRPQGDLLTVLVEGSIRAVDQLHRLAVEYGPGIEWTAHFDPDRQRRCAQDGAGCRIAGQHLRAGGRREPGIGDEEAEDEIASAPREAAAGQEWVEMKVAVAADGQIVRPDAQQFIERGDAAIGLAIDLRQQAMAVRVVGVPEIVGVVVEQADDPVERRGRLLSHELEVDAGGAIERETVPFHVDGALGTVADGAVLLKPRAGAEMPQVDGLVQGLVGQFGRSDEGACSEGRRHQAPRLEPLESQPRGVPARWPRPR